MQGLDRPGGIGFAEVNGMIYWLSVAPPDEPSDVPATSATGIGFLVLLLLAGSLAVRSMRFRRTHGS